MGWASLRGKASAAFLFALALLLPGIGAGYWGRDEADYAGVAHAMNATGDFVVPRLFGQAFPDKPPLAEWSTALSFHIFGEREAAGRLPHVLLAAGSAALVLLLGARLLDARTGWIASLLFASSLLFIVYGRLLLTDAELLFFTLLSILGLASILEKRRGFWPVLMAGAALGLAVLAKGPVAFLAPGLFCAGALAGGADRSRATLARLAAALVAAFIVAVPWFWFAARATGGQSLAAFWLRENLGRFLAPMQGHRGSILSMPVVAWFGFFPWSGLLVDLPWRGLLRREPARWGLLAWAGGVLVFFSLAATKLPHYLLPALPAIALLAAADQEAIARRRRTAAWATAATGAVLILAGVAAVCVVAQAGAFALLIPLGGAGLCALAAPLLFVSDRRKEKIGLAALFVASTAIAWGTIPVLDGLRSADRLGLAARAARQAGEPLGGLRIHEAVLTYYAGAVPTQVWRDFGEITRAAAASPSRSALVWLDSADSAGLARRARCRVRILNQGPSLTDPRVRGALQLVRVELRR